MYSFPAFYSIEIIVNVTSLIDMYCFAQFSFVLVVCFIICLVWLVGESTRTNDWCDTVCQVQLFDIKPQGCVQILEFEFQDD